MPICSVCIVVTAVAYHTMGFGFDCRISHGCLSVFCILMPDLWVLCHKWPSDSMKSTWYNSPLPTTSQNIINNVYFFYILYLIFLYFIFIFTAIYKYFPHIRSYIYDSFAFKATFYSTKVMALSLCCLKLRSLSLNRLQYNKAVNLWCYCFSQLICDCCWSFFENVYAAEYCQLNLRFHQASTLTQKFSSPGVNSSGTLNRMIDTYD